MKRAPKREPDVQDLIDAELARRAKQRAARRKREAHREAKADGCRICETIADARSRGYIPLIRQCDKHPIREAVQRALVPDLRQPAPALDNAIAALDDRSTSIALIIPGPTVKLLNQLLKRGLHGTTLEAVVMGLVYAQLRALDGDGRLRVP